VEIYVILKNQVTRIGTERNYKITRTSLIVLCNHLLLGILIFLKPLNFPSQKWEKSYKTVIEPFIKLQKKPILRIRHKICLRVVGYFN